MCVNTPNPVHMDNKSSQMKSTSQDRLWRRASAVLETCAAPGCKNNSSRLHGWDAWQIYLPLPSHPGGGVRRCQNVNYVTDEYVWASGDTVLLELTVKLGCQGLMYWIGFCIKLVLFASIWFSFHPKICVCSQLSILRIWANDINL